jgi:hypothetical protein
MVFNKSFTGKRRQVLKSKKFIELKTSINIMFNFEIVSKI